MDDNGSPSSIVSRPSKKCQLIKMSKLSPLKILLLFSSVVLISAFITGYYYIQKHKEAQNNEAAEKSNPTNSHAAILDSIVASKIKDNLRYLTRKQHISGSLDSYKQVLYLKRFYEKAGFDKVEVAEYDVLLSYPKKPSYISLTNEVTKKILYDTTSLEKVLWKDENVKNVVYPFNAFSPPGDVKGKLIYVNYGREEDFQTLAKMNINVTGCIAIARYGKVFRGDKAEAATKAGAIALILYSDPKDSSRGGLKYPHSWWLPEDGVQRGDLSFGPGDILTPGYPAIDEMYRIPFNKTKRCIIPVQPISSGDALPLLKQLDGIKAPKLWQGGLNMTYHVTMKDENPNKIRLVVSTEYKITKIHNVIATLEGKTEPDRHVIMGNHHDAWVFGATDPSSGTAVVMEIGRALGAAKKKGWRPRRTIKLCAWDAEEYGLIGSTEWVEENKSILRYEAVAYLNIDQAVIGGYSILAKGSAQIPEVLFNAAKQIRDPDETNRSLFETWKKKRPNFFYKEYPRISFPGSGSDYLSFFNKLGIPVIDLKYTYDKNEYRDLDSYPLYHSVHDSFHYVETFVDKDFKYHKTLAKLFLQTGLKLADEKIIPFNYVFYARVLQKCYHESVRYAELLERHNITLKPLKRAIETFTKASKRFQSLIAGMKTSSDLKVRMVNDRLMHIGRTFIADGQNSKYGHIVYSPSEGNSYKSVCFAELYKNLFDLLEGKASDWSVVAEHLNMIVYYIRQAIPLLEFK